MSTQIDGIFPIQPSPYAAATLAELENFVENATRISSEESTSRGWPKLSTYALYGLAGDVVRSIAPHSEADPAAILVQFLVAAANMFGPKPHCLVESTRHGLNLFGILVGETSKARKGTSWSHVERICALVDEQWARERIASGLSSAEGLIAEVADDSHVSKDRRLLVVEGEFSSVLRMMSREGNNLSSTLRAAWDCGNLRTMTKHDPLRATGAHISAVAHITRPELLRHLRGTEQRNGFANRFLWCCVRRSQYLPEGGCVPEGQMRGLGDGLQRVIGFAKDCGEIRRDESARKMWASIYPSLSNGLPGLLGAVTSRAEAQVLRMAAIYAVLDCSEVVQIEHLSAALALWDYCLASARYIFGDSTGDPMAERIRESLAKAGAAGMSRTQIRDLFKHHASIDRIGQALEQLAALGIVNRRLRRTEGRSVEMWFATATEATEAPEG